MPGVGSASAQADDREIGERDREEWTHDERADRTQAGRQMSSAYDGLG